MADYLTITAIDGFGSQYQKIIESYIFCKMNNLNFAYTPLNVVEHNYDNDPSFNIKLEKLMNIKDNIINVNDSMNINYIEYSIQIHKNFSENIDMYCNSVHMQYIKDCFWKNKEKDFFTPFRIEDAQSNRSNPFISAPEGGILNENWCKNGKTNISIHIRRENVCDRGQAGDRVTTPNEYYLNIMNNIRQQYTNTQFHIYSQGDIEQFNDLDKADVIFHLNEDIYTTFIGLVAANILVTSPSSLSYTAAMLSDGIVYYRSFWHSPRKEWIL